jgi:succinate dehydrogenase/fumarate reductase flavoprotein subunit
MENRDMSKVPHRLVVVGHGAAGLTAAVAAAEAARSHDLAVEITLLEKAAPEAAGGNTLWSPSYMRLDANDRIAPDFEDAMLEACDGRGDRLYFRTLAENATATVAWLERHGVAFCAPIYYLSAGPRRFSRSVAGAPSSAHCRTPQEASASSCDTGVLRNESSRRGTAALEGSSRRTLAGQGRFLPMPLSSRPGAFRPTAK